YEAKPCRRAGQPCRRSGVPCVAARSAPPMQSAPGASPQRARGGNGLAAGRGPLLWDSIAVLTHHAKILPRKQGLATPDFEVLRALLPRNSARPARRPANPAPTVAGACANM